MSDRGPRFDQPIVEGDSEPFWHALTDGKLMIVHCRACDQFTYYPRPFCPQCWSDDVEWVEASGEATVYSYSTVYVNDLPPFGSQVPYVAAVVELAEGPRMMTRLVGVENPDIAIGMAVAFEPANLDGELQMAVFRPA